MLRYPCRALAITQALALLFAMNLSLASAEEFPTFDQLQPSAELPALLIDEAGKPITTAEAWSKKRDTLKAQFQHWMYGRLPPKPAQVKYETLFTDEKALGGKATVREIRISFVEPALSKRQHVLLVTPNGVEKPGVFIGMNFCGNHTVLPDTKIALPEGWVGKGCVGVENERATDAGRGAQTEVWNAELIVSRGYALATFYSGDIDPDTPDLADGIGPAFYKPGQTAAEGDDAGTIALWAWGFHRVADLVTTEFKDTIDASKIASVGHSRNGKTALLAAAMDDRFSIAIPSQAGCGGTAPSRGKVGEQVKQINKNFPHWFCDNFLLFNEHPDLLPFDQHALVAICAPRAVLFANAEEDTWANPMGQFEVLQAAEPVFKLLGTSGLAEAKEPVMNQLVGGRLGFFYRPGKHSMSTTDWTAYLDFADQQWK
ncbi:putative acetyl xylan esterase [Pirellula staleyi DSM 6068]|uniref:Putative acetyl xylan esterase n=1 Tax=Pirellula staleyi (strain ATCC 27377 / DSM 6068 / ICPB 4128) TaxID=530564 RepID=D2R0N7_PIRSD|nr:acetylxylan esterase [Pirellula staleyi]ADB16635.1 putative acetyl xylan esterase [Pirellula staleyi DSM 6068]